MAENLRQRRNINQSSLAEAPKRAILLWGGGGSKNKGEKKEKHVTFGYIPPGKDDDGNVSRYRKHVAKDMPTIPIRLTADLEINM